MTRTILFEAFGSIKNENMRKDGVTLDDVIAEAFTQLSEFVNFDDVERIYTGMNADVSYALIDHVNENDLDIEIRTFYPNVNNIAEEDDISRNEAWKKGYTWRNNKLFVEDEDNDQETVDLTVRVGDAGSNGSHLMQQSRQKGVPALDLNLDTLVNRDMVYGDGTTSTAEA